MSGYTYCTAGQHRYELVKSLFWNVHQIFCLTKAWILTLTTSNRIHQVFLKKLFPNSLTQNLRRRFSDPRHIPIPSGVYGLKAVVPPCDHISPNETWHKKCTRSTIVLYLMVSNCSPRTTKLSSLGNFYMNLRLIRDKNMSLLTEGSEKGWI